VAGSSARIVGNGRRVERAGWPNRNCAAPAPASGGYIVFPGPLAHPRPEPHERAQPLQFEALYARNAGKNAITGMSTTAFDATGGVAQPAPFPIAKAVLPNPRADPRTGHRSPDASGRCPRGQALAPGSERTALDDRFHSASWPTFLLGHAGPLSQDEQPGKTRRCLKPMLGHSFTKSNLL